MYLDACLQKRQHFPPFFASVDGLLGVEALAKLKSISSRLATKWRQPYSRTFRYVKSMIAITFGAVHTPVHPGVLDASAQDQHTSPG